MYGMGGYGSYGSMGGYGGMSSYGGYGSGYGSSYGSYGSRLGTNATASATSTDANGNPESKDPNNPNSQNNPQQQNQRKMFLEQWFKMMGGLQSIIQMGFAMIALANFWGKGAEISKQFMSFSKATLKSVARFVESKLPKKLIKSMTSPENRGKTIKAVMMGVIRIFASVLLFLGFKLRMDIRRQAKQNKQKMQRQLEQLKSGEIELMEEDPHEQMPLQVESTLQQANL